MFKLKFKQNGRLKINSSLVITITGIIGGELERVVLFGPRKLH